jgi:hypothetical protein
MSRVPIPVPVPVSPPVRFATPTGGTVQVTAVPGSRIPYDWECSSGHQADQRYAALPYCRDDAKDHADGCEGTAGVTA